MFDILNFVLLLSVSLWRENFKKVQIKKSIMKSLKKADIEALKKVMPILEETEQRTVVGGSGYENGALVYTYAEYEAMEASGQWVGGVVSNFEGDEETLSGNIYVAQTAVIFGGSGSENINYYPGLMNFLNTYGSLPPVVNMLIGISTAIPLPGVSDFVQSGVSVVRVASDTEISNIRSQVAGNGFYFGIVNGQKRLYNNAGVLVSSW
jgi:hypothetical protein